MTENQRLKSGRSRGLLQKISLSWLAILLLLLSAAAFAQQPLNTVLLSPQPSPDELSAAKQALARGDIVAMIGGTVRDFDGFLGLGIEPARPEPETGDSGAGSPPAEYVSVVAARLAPNGSLHSFTAYTNSFLSAEQDGKEALEQWAADQQAEQESELSQQSAMEANLAPDVAPNEPSPLSWTLLTEDDRRVPGREGPGNFFSDRIKIYRLNEAYSNGDWYLVYKSSFESHPNYEGCTNPLGPCGWWTDSRDYKIFTEPGFQLYEHDPLNVGGSVSYSIGGTLSAPPGASAGFSVSWNQPDVSTSDRTNGNVAQWHDGFKGFSNFCFCSPPDTSKRVFISRPAALFKVPENTEAFDAVVQDAIKWNYVHPVFKIYPDDPSATFRYHVSPPRFEVAPSVLDITPGGTGELHLLAQNLLAPIGFPWAIAIPIQPSWLRIDRTTGTISSLITIGATPDAPVGDYTFLEIQTNPPYGAPTVEQGPLRVRINIVANSPTAPRGQVLLAGGVPYNGGAPYNTAEVWDPVTFKVTPAANTMSEARDRPAATLLLDGTILIAGGFRSASGLNPSASADVYNPSTNSFTAARSEMNQARGWHTATLFTSGALRGKVLLAGGCCTLDGAALESAELYDPQAGTFTPTGSLRIPRFDHQATLLPNGEVLIAGGTTSYGACAGVSESEIYNPDTQTFRLSGKLNPGRHQVADVLLNNGQVLVAGGSNCGSSAMRNAGLYTAGDGAFTATGALNTARSLAAGVLLPSNLQALIVGGINGGRTAELFDTSNNTFRPTLGLMQEQRDYTAVTALLNTGTGFDGDILVAGGVPPGTGNSGGKLLELYDPSRGTFSPAGSMSVPRSLFTVTEFRKVAP